MLAPHPARSIAQRVDDALAMAAANGRTPTVLVLGKEDYPAFKAWAERELRLDIERDSYRRVQVRPNPSIYLSRVMLQTERGLPNAVMI